MPPPAGHPPPAAPPSSSSPGDLPTPTIKSFPMIVQYALSNLQQKSGLDPSTLPPPILKMMAGMPGDNVALAINEYSSMDLKNAGNKSHLLMGVLNKHACGK